MNLGYDTEAGAEAGEVPRGDAAGFLLSRHLEPRPVSAGLGPRIRV